MNTPEIFGNKLHIVCWYVFKLFINILFNLEDMQGTNRYCCTYWIRSRGT